MAPSLSSCSGIGIRETVDVSSFCVFCVCAFVSFVAAVVTRVCVVAAGGVGQYSTPLLVLRLHPPLSLRACAFFRFYFRHSR